MRYINESVYVSHLVAIPISYINLGCDIRTKCVFGEIGRFHRRVRDEFDRYSEAEFATQFGWPSSRIVLIPSDLS